MPNPHPASVISVPLWSKLFKEKQFIELQTEYTNKLGILNNKLAEVNGDAQEFAQKIYNDQISKQGAE